MKARGEESMTVTVETTRGYEVMEMHLFDENASRERLPGGPVGGHSVGAVCEGCKTLVMPFAGHIIQGMGDRWSGGRGGGVSAACRHAAEGDRGRGLQWSGRQSLSSMCATFFAFQEVKGP